LEGAHFIQWEWIPHLFSRSLVKRWIKLFSFRGVSEDPYRQHSSLRPPREIAPPLQLRKAVRTSVSSRIHHSSGSSFFTLSPDGVFCDHRSPACPLELSILMLSTEISAYIASLLYDLSVLAFPYVPSRARTMGPRISDPASSLIFSDSCPRQEGGVVVRSEAKPFNPHNLGRETIRVASLTPPGTFRLLFSTVEARPLDLHFYPREIFLVRINPRSPSWTLKVSDPDFAGSTFLLLY